MGVTSFSSASPTLLFVGELDDLSFQLVTTLLNKNFNIYLFSQATATWKGVIDSEKYRNLKIIKRKDISKIKIVDYFIFHINFFRVAKSPPEKIREDFINQLQAFAKTPWSQRSKNLWLIPALKGLHLNKTLLKGRTIYFSETFGAHMVFANFPTLKIFETSVKKMRLTLPDNQVFLRPILAEALANKIIRVMFSISYSYETTFLGEKVSQMDLIRLINKDSFLPEVVYLQKVGPEYLLTKETSILNSRAEIEKATQYLKQKPTKEEQAGKGKRKVLKLAALTLFLILIIPLVLTCMSFVGLFVSYRLVRVRQFNAAQKASANSFYLSSAANKEWDWLSGLPVVGQVFYAPAKVNRIFLKSAKLGEEATGIIIEAQELANKFLGDERYPVSNYAERMSTEIDNVYEETGFILSEINASALLKSIFGLIVNNNLVEETRGQLIGLGQLVKSLPQLLGEKQSKKYLVLLQNNMELRPTGGYIGSFALVTLDGGRIGEIVLWDVFEADGQLKGHIEPPAPIKAYLGEANWFLRDSNWDPDFAVSAQRAQWFLEKEIDENVDGVVGVDLEFVKTLLTITGPIEISDYEEAVNANNLYEVTQREVEENFFPGSKKKSTFLTALSKKLSEEIKDVSSEKRTVLGTSLIELFEQRHLQIYFNEPFVQGAIEKLGWGGGEVTGFACGNNCYSDFFGTIEANVGVNKANLYITREMAASINLKDGNAFKVLNLNIKNSASKEYGPKGEYKAYIRLLVPTESVLENITLTKEGRTTHLTADINNVSLHKEIGILAIINPGQSGVINFSWRTPAKISLERSGQYKLLVRKQAGTLATPLELNYLLGSGLVIKEHPPFSLTRQDYYGYNTSLTKDFVSQISW